jgi:SAM-dependent methyltransferase
VTLEKTDRWLESVYNVSSREELASIYDHWAETYDADMKGVGYVHPAVMAGLTARYVPDKASAVLDAGVGTGTLGNILSILGYSNLIGVDMSEGMLARARNRNIYADLRNRVLGEHLDFVSGSVDAVVSTGVFTAGHGPASACEELVRITRPGVACPAGATGPHHLRRGDGSLPSDAIFSCREHLDHTRPCLAAPLNNRFSAPALPTILTPVEPPSRARPWH